VRDAVGQFQHDPQLEDITLLEILYGEAWGLGYPGWHIECTGISIKYLGEYLDIHGGGVDNIFPHHTNEIAQSESYLGHKWCNYWFHNEHLIDETGKMSKSKGGILTVSKLEEQGFNPLSFRFMCLGSHYRKQLLFTNDNLVQAENTYKKLLKKISNINEEGKKDINHFDLYIEKFKCQLENDLNTSNALSILYELLTDNAVNGTTKISIIKEFDKVLASDLCANNTEISIELEDEINELINKRMLAKKNKDFEQADNIRNELLKKGIKLKDTREGTSYEIVKD
jgi:cysteinyl-tRNA synthetase